MSNKVFQDSISRYTCRVEKVHCTKSSADVGKDFPYNFWVSTIQQSIFFRIVFQVR